jgi:hypothetical protein
MSLFNIVGMKKSNIILIHSLYWFYIINQLLFPAYVGFPGESEMVGGEYFKDVVISLFLNVFSFYAVYFAFPRFSAVRNIFLIVGIAVLMIIVIIAVRVPLNWYFWKIFGNLPPEKLKFEWLWVWNELRMVVITGIYAILIRFMINMFEAQKLRDELINQRQAGELALLRSQVNPHFLFNTLNNIYSLVYNKSDDAAEAVMKFSSIMRYVLYEAPEQKVLLDKEIEYLQNYIELQKLRYRQPGIVKFEIKGVTEGISIAPMLLIPFIENAFKHGSKDKEPAVLIHLATDEMKIRFDVVNYTGKNQKHAVNQISGIELSNIKRRLELIYPGKHELNMGEENGQYKVKLVVDF